MASEEAQVRWRGWNGAWNTSGWWDVMVIDRVGEAVPLNRHLWACGAYGTCLGPPLRLYAAIIFLTNNGRAFFLGKAVLLGLQISCLSEIKEGSTCYNNKKLKERDSIMSFLPLLRVKGPSKEPTKVEIWFF